MDRPCTVARVRKARAPTSVAVITALRNAADESGYPNEAAVFGGGLARQLFQALNAGCCASSGVDLFEAMRIYGYAFAYDRDLNAAVNIAREGRRILEGTAGLAGNGDAKASRTLVEQA